jgi:hypothetical protein
MRNWTGLFVGMAFHSALPCTGDAACTSSGISWRLLKSFLITLYHRQLRCRRIFGSPSFAERPRLACRLVDHLPILRLTGIAGNLVASVQRKKALVDGFGQARASGNNTTQAFLGVGRK